MLSMFFTYILYAEVVDEEAKLDGAPFVAPKARSSGRLEVSRLVEALAKEIISQSSTLGEAITAFNYLEKYPPIVYVLLQVIFVNEFLGDVFEFDLDVFWALHRSTQVEVGDVKAAKFGVRTRQHTINYKLNEFQRCGRGGDFAGEDDTIPSHGNSGTIGIFLVGFNFADDAGEANFLAPILGDVFKLDKALGVRTFHTLFLGAFGSSADPLTEPT